MNFWIDAGILAASYIFGSVPFGLIVVKLMTGKDVRTIASGRTGGTNAMRAAGLWAGLLTAILDILKSAATVWLAQLFTPNVWIHAIAPIAAVLGHNYSIFMIERGPDNRIRLRGGAGGAAAGGGALGLWPPAALFLLPIGLAVWYGIGYASITTLSIGLITLIIFGVRAALGLGPWQYTLYGMLALTLMLWTLRPNIKRLKEGTERRHGLPAILQQRRQAGLAKDTK
ncbi:MAG TPA: glycerol-3-phosphate acyltransferase [Anaerolineales bacterium]|nr:glycerol-3-phosphate acyltransferase [Anaerolineales bacterium]